MATLTLLPAVRDYEAELEALRVRYESLRGRYQTVVHERDRLEEQRLDQLEASSIVCDGDACSTMIALIAPRPVEPMLLRLAAKNGWKQSAIATRHFCPVCAGKLQLKQPIKP
jgi:hypothetical protein